MLRGVAAASAAGIVAVLLTAGGATAAGNTRFVSPGGSSGAADTSCATAAYSDISSAVAAAPVGGTVVVCHGVYHEMVTIDQSLTLKGRAGAVVQASGFDNGVRITHSWVTVEGLTVRGATGEGILAMGSPDTNTSIDHVRIMFNVVRNNDRGGPDSSYGECQPQGQVPGDCGEGIHLMSVFDSRVRGNVVEYNSGGILLSDEFGPTHDNVISQNLVTNNMYDCGITLASHNAGWDPGSSSTTPSVAGVYANRVVGNVVQRNGLKGEGAGVLIAAAFPLAAAYDNTVLRNVISGNDMAGVTIHSHPGGGYVNDNSIIGNHIGRNNLHGDPDAGVSATTGVIVYSTDQPTHVMIRWNVIHDDHFGVWYDGAQVSPSFAHDVYLRVAVPIKNG